jgi:hypothetical protein
MSEQELPTEKTKPLVGVGNGTKLTKTYMSLKTGHGVWSVEKQKIIHYRFAAVLPFPVHIL